MRQISFILGVVAATFGLPAPVLVQASDLDDAEAIFRVDPTPEPPAAEPKRTEAAAEPGPGKSGKAAMAKVPEGDVLPAEYLENVMVVKTDWGTGTGFLCTHKDRLFVATNQHVLADAKSLEITGPTGEVFKPTHFVAARNVDIVLIGVLPGPNLRRPLVFAEDVEEVVTKGDAILIPGNSKGDGVITVTSGKVIGLGANKVEVDCPVAPGNSGGPIFHVRTREIIGLLTEERQQSLEGAVDAGVLKDGKSQIKSEVRVFGHRFDTAEKWYALNVAEFQRHSELIRRVRTELDAIEAFFFPVETIDWKKCRELNTVVSTTGRIITTEKLSEADRTRAWTSLTGSLGSLSTRGVRELEAQRPALAYSQVQDLDLLAQRAEYLRQLSAVLAHDRQATTTLVNRASGRKPSPEAGLVESGGRRKDETRRLTPTP